MRESLEPEQQLFILFGIIILEHFSLSALEDTLAFDIVDPWIDRFPDHLV